MKPPHILAAAAVLLAGCATWTFEPTRSSKFVNEENAYLHVDYGLEEHESTFIGPGGVQIKTQGSAELKLGVNTKKVNSSPGLNLSAAQ